MLIPALNGDLTSNVIYTIYYKTSKMTMFICILRFKVIENGQQVEAVSGELFYFGVYFTFYFSKAQA